MKDYLAEQMRGQPPLRGRNLAREYLQARILAALQRAGAMIPLALHGGTALRFLHGAPRFSEDLDFALERAPEQYDFRAYLERVRSTLSAEGYTVELKVNDRKVVHSAFVQFRGLLYELGLSPLRDETFSVKIEVDTRPPAGATLATTVVRRHVILRLQHHDRASLLAGKLHAILSRPYAKGRDWYDLLWYLSDPGWPPPNLVMLNNALEQTGWPGPRLSLTNWRATVRRRALDLDWGRVADDVRPFLETSAEADLLTKDTLLQALGH